MSKIVKKGLSIFIMITIILSAMPISVQADITVVKRVNVLLNKQPITNSTHGEIKNIEAATDGITNASANDGKNTEIIAGVETGDQGNKNGYDDWDHVYLQYDFGKTVSVDEIKIYRNTYSIAVSTFKRVKVELSQTEDFAQSEVVFGEMDVVEEVNTKGQPQVIKLDTPKEAKYIRIWGQGHYIQNHVGSWKGYSNALRFHEIEVIALVSDEGGNDNPSQPEEELHNIAKDKVPYVYGLEPTDIANITDNDWDNYAIHNSVGERWLQFEYRNSYPIKKIEFKLEPGNYESVEISVSNDPTREGHKRYQDIVFKESNFNQGQDKNVITLQNPVRGSNIRFLVKKSNDEPTKYSEIAIWSTNPLKNEQRPEYQEPSSSYNKLVWVDDFNDIDEDRWNIIEGMANHGAIYNRDAVSIVEDGENKYLSIRSKNYNTTEELIQAVGYDKYNDIPLASHVTWSSGRLESKNKFSFQYGRMATRAKVNDSRGIWPAIWMLCQDETGHDEIDVLEYLGQDAHGAWTTNHYGIWGKNKAAHGREKKNYEAWSQAFHVYEVEWSPENIIWYIDGEEVFRTTQGKHLDGMHSRPMFPILETQVGDGWVGKVDFEKQETKQDSSFLIDWIKVYQSENQEIVRFDDLETLTGGKNDSYRIPIQSASENLMLLTHGEESYKNKNNFFYGGQPRYEKNRVAVKEDAEGEQFIIYEIPNVKDVHLTAYYQTLPDKVTHIHTNSAGDSGHSIREFLKDGANIDFKIFTSKDGNNYRPFNGTKVVNNFIEVHPAYARTTFDAYDLPNKTRFVKIVFPEYKGKKYIKGNGQEEEIKHTDIQLAKVTFLQKQGEIAEEDGEPRYNVYPSLRQYTKQVGYFEASADMRMVIVANEKANKNAAVREVVQLLNQEFAANGIPSNATMPIYYGEKSEAKAGDIVIELKDTVEDINVAEGFRISIGEKVEVQAKDRNGVMYALRTVMQYLQRKDKMPYGVIVDYPETEERALHLDMGRKYFTPEWIKRTIRELSYMRLNAIQLHFSEHEGFRLECETYPNVVSKDYITKEQMREIIAEAKKYGVEIIPSFDNPGHLRQALRNYPELELVDNRGIRHSGALDINKDEARQFVKNILKEYAELFVDSKYFHIGGDEFINFNNFNSFPSLQEFGQKHVEAGVTATGLDGYMAYINEIAAFVKDMGFVPRIWHDGVYRRNISHHINLHDYIQVCYWTRWDANMVDTAGLINKKHDLINVNDKMYYVLARNAYLEKPNTRYIYEEWHSGVYADGQKYNMPHDKTKGSCYAIWCDVPLKETEQQITTGIYYSLRAMAEKSWSSQARQLKYNDFVKLLDELKAIQDFNMTLPAVKEIQRKENLVEVRFRFVNKKGQVLGREEAVLGEKGEAYNFTAPLFKEHQLDPNHESLSGIFDTDKVIVLTYSKVIKTKHLEEAIKDPAEESLYLAESYAPYKNAIEKAKQLLQSSEITDVQINQAIAEIRKTEGELVKKEWKPLFDRLKNLKPREDYTEVSYIPYLRVANELKGKIRGKDSDVSQLDAYILQLDNAEKGLQSMGDLVKITVTPPDESYWSVYSYDKMLDGSRTSFAWTSYVQEEGHQFVFQFAKPIILSGFTLVYPQGFGEDYIKQAKFEVEVDGQWKEVGTIQGKNQEQTFVVDKLKTTKARIRITEEKANWLKIAETEFKYTKADTPIIPQPEPQPEPQPQPEVLLPYIPEVVEEPVKEEVIEEEEIALASPEELSKWTDGLEKAADKELVKRLLEQKVTPEELVKHFSEEGLAQLAKQVSDVFVDEKAGTWYQKELAMAILLKLVNGYGDDTFRAENKVTGKELVAILLRAGKVTVEANEKDWFAPYLEMAKKEKLLTEVNFDLNKELSREEVALLVYNFMMRNRSHRQLPNRTLRFQDKEEIATDLRDAVSYLYEKEIIKGYEDESYRPKSPVKRSEIVAIIYRMLKNK